MSEPTHLRTEEASLVTEKMSKRWNPPYSRSRGVKLINPHPPKKLLHPLGQGNSRQVVVVGNLIVRNIARDFLSRWKADGSCKAHY